MSGTADPTDRTAEALAEAAWWHLVNRHDLAQALDEPGAVSHPREQLLAAVEQLTRETDECPRDTHSRPSALFSPTGGHR